MRLPARVARVIGTDPDGTLVDLFEDYTRWSRRARSRQRALVAIAIAAPVLVGLLWLGMLVGDHAFGGTHAGVAFVLAALSACGATALYLNAREQRDRAEVLAVDDRGEIRRTYRRAAAMLLREEDLTDDELAELVQSTRDVRRTRIAAGVHGAHAGKTRVDIGELAEGPVSSAPPSVAPPSAGETADTRGSSEQGGTG